MKNTQLLFSDCISSFEGTSYKNYSHRSLLLFLYCFCQLFMSADIIFYTNIIFFYHKFPFLNGQPPDLLFLSCFYQLSHQQISFFTQISFSFIHSTPLLSPLPKLTVKIYLSMLLQCKFCFILTQIQNQFCFDYVD